VLKDGGGQAQCSAKGRDSAARWARDSGRHVLQDGGGQAYCRGCSKWKG